MPFFLVTQTSLVEAQDEQEAAQTGVDRLRSGEQVTVVEQPLPGSPFETINTSPSTVAITKAASATPESRKVILKRMMADALALLRRRA
jgi:hypothetical protein